jgi:hypothetical protein
MWSSVWSTRKADTMASDSAVAYILCAHCGGPAGVQRLWCRHPRRVHTRLPAERARVPCAAHGAGLLGDTAAVTQQQVRCHTMHTMHSMHGITYVFALKALSVQSSVWHHELHLTVISACMSSHQTSQYCLSGSSKLGSQYAQHASFRQLLQATASGNSFRQLLQATASGNSIQMRPSQRRCCCE